jgi:SnoaL-like domain
MASECGPVSVQRWIDGWSIAWNSGDASALEGVYAEGCSFRSHPFREVEHPLEYARRALVDEEEVDARFGEPVVDGDRAAVEWWATLREAGEEITLAGCSILRFDSHGRCVEQRDYWTQGDGRRPPFAGWGT